MTDQRTASPPERTHRHRRALVWAVGTLLVAELFARLLAVALPEPLSWANYEQQRKLHRLEEIVAAGECPQAVVVGSSVAAAAVDAGVAGRHGLATYNASLAGGGVLVVPWWLREVVLPRSCDATVVIAVGPRDLNESSPELGYLEDYLTSDGRLIEVGAATWWQRARVQSRRWSALFALQGPVSDVDATLDWLGGRGGEWEDRNDDLGTLQAFADETLPPPPQRVRNDREVIFADYRLEGPRSDAVAEGIAATRAAGRRVALVLLPYTEETVDLVGGVEVLNRYEELMAQVADTGGAVLVDLSGVVSNPEQFADNYHLNASGADALSVALAERLRAWAP